MSERTARLDELLREEISEVIRREVDDPRIGFVTITSVDVSRDLSHANVWVSVIGTPDEKRSTLRALSHAMPFVRRRLGRLRLKRIPALHVKEDETAERGTRLLHILDELEHGGAGEIDGAAETLPTPLGTAAHEDAAREQAEKSVESAKVEEA
ncbi:MAG TPA: 30S ribosome-binding factor RbfA [Candidatus Limnocylindrales bacterium]|nr:30S ribosome-binding factor RbfA [Candidatus Limnocylindrales bacterium]